MKYLLDTNACIDYIRDARGIRDRYEEYDIQEVAIAAIVYSELQFGAGNCKDRKRNLEALEEFCAGLTILDFPARAGGDYGAIRRELQDKGRMIGANDLFIAAHARSEALILVTNDRGFGEIEGLAVEDWTAA